MNDENMKAIIDLAASQQNAKTPSIDRIGEVPYIAIPNTYRVESLEPLLPMPTRKRANVVTLDADSFIEYVSKHSSSESMIYANLDSEQARISMVALIDDNSLVSPAWREHRCQYAPKLSVEWKQWFDRNGKEMSQIDFATFIENNIGDIVSVNGSASGTDMLAMALAFERNADKKLSSRVNLQSGGVRFEYVDDDTKGTKSAMEAFNRFHIGVPVFYNSSSAYPVEVRLKYREREGKVIFWFDLVRPDRAFKTAADEVISLIQEKTGLVIINATP